MYLNTMWQVNRERRSELLQIAQAGHLVRKSRAGLPRRKDRVLLNVGDLMVSWGMRLKARYEPAG